VVDAAAPAERREADMRAVDEVLEEIGAADAPRLLVLNKADLLDCDGQREALLRHPGGVLVSALEGTGVEELEDAIAAAFEETLREVELLVPYDEGARLSELYDLAGELDRTARPDGVLVRARVPSAELHRFADLSTNGAG
jgi:GTP-binding protein HflX